MLDLFTFDEEPQRPINQKAADSTASPGLVHTAQRMPSSSSRAYDQMFASKQRESRKSQESLVAKFMALDPIAYDRFNERAAILQYDVGMTRAEAERRAYRDVLQSL